MGRLDKVAKLGAGSAAAVDAHWKHLTGIANEAFVEGNLERAKTLYSAALDEAERLFNASIEHPVPVPASVIFNVSCHNLAEFFRHVGDSESCERMLLHAFNRLGETAKTPATRLKQRLACVEDLKRALIALVAHLKSRQADAGEIEGYIRRARAIALSVFHANEYAHRWDDNCTRGPLPRA